MEPVILDVQQWAEHEFSQCDLGDKRRTKRLVRFAQQAAARPDEGTPDQAETWADLKGVYRLFDQDKVTPQAILTPHCEHTRQACQAGDVKLLISDTTELNFTSHKKTTGLGAVASGKQRGFHVHSGLMVDATSEEIDGLAGQVTFHRPPPAKKKKKGAKNSRRRDPQRESVVWGRLIEEMGSPPAGVKWIQVCDRGADDYEVLLRARRQQCSCVIRVAHLNRNVVAPEGRTVPLQDLLQELPVSGTREVNVTASHNQQPRKAQCEVRFSQLGIPIPSVTNQWIREHAPPEPLPMWVVELREMNPPAGSEAIRWVLYTYEAVHTLADAERVVRFYELRWTIEDFHKALKTGCQIESRNYHTSDRLERVLAFSSVVAIRLLRFRTAAKKTPDRPARELAPQAWLAMLKQVRRIPAEQEITIREFVRHLGGLGGHLGRKCDGEPGWSTLWRGHEKLCLLLRGATAAKRCG
jgi:hypothetical protein